LGLTFFGLTPKIAPQVRKNLFTQIHNIVYHGNGGYDYNTIYNMPIWLRKFTFTEIQNYVTEENKKIKEAQEGKGKQTLVNSDGKINRPEFAKASKAYKQAEQNLKKFKGKTGFK
tara:strand:- start:66 stop:410 length:345 start_codon:yes stop_codon:yes gene_type:complete